MNTYADVFELFKPQGIQYVPYPQPMQWTWATNPVKRRNVHYHAARPGRRWK